MEEVSIAQSAIDIKINSDTLLEHIKKAVQESIEESVKRRVYFSLKDDSLKIARDYLFSPEIEAVIVEIMRAEVLDMALKTAKRSRATMKKHIREALERVYEEEITKRIYLRIYP